MDKIDGTLIRFYRRKRKQSQEWLAEQVGIDQSAIHRWETGNVPKTWKQYAALCEALDIEQVDLLSRDSRAAYNWLLVNYEDALVGGNALAIARLSAQVLNWERFFNTGKFGDDELTDDEEKHSNETERELAEMMRGRT